MKNNHLLSDYANLGDARLNKRLAKICNQFSKSFASSIPNSSSTRSQAKAAYNFFDNKKVSMPKIIAGHREVHQRDKKKVQKQTLLVPQDSTNLDYTKTRSAKDFGPLCYEHQRGCILHNSMIISSSGVPIGLFKQSTIIRSDEDFGKKKAKPRLIQPIEEKESYRWIEHFKELQDYYSPYPDIEVFSICDREGDMHELFCAQDSSNVHLIVRSKHNRSLVEESSGTESPSLKLHDKVAASPVQARYKIKVTNRKTCKKRKAEVELRFCPVKVKVSYPNKWQKDLPAVSLWVVQITEINPPKGKKAVQWTLLSTKPVETVLAAKTIIRYYELRWLIERFHYVLKSGGKITDLQLGTPKRILNAVAAYSVGAINVMRMNYLAREHPDLTIYDLGISPEEYRILYQYAHVNMDKRLVFAVDDPPSIKEYVIVIARLGGFTKYNTKNSILPGLKTFWRGWKKFQAIQKTYYTFMSKN